MSYCHGDLQVAWSAGHQDSTEHGWAHVEAPPSVYSPDDPDTNLHALVVTMIQLIFDPRSGAGHHTVGEDQYGHDSGHTAAGVIAVVSPPENGGGGVEIRTSLDE